MIRAYMGDWTNKNHSAYIKDNPAINKYYLRTLETANFVIGDNPIVFNAFPDNMEQLYQSSYFFPVSSKKLYLKNVNPHLVLTHYPIWLNALIIEQSKKYICSNDLELLKRSIEKYKELKDYGTLQNIRDALFAKTG